MLMSMIMYEEYQKRWKDNSNSYANINSDNVKYTRI